jgi:hypothetical protein
MLRQTLVAAATSIGRTVTKAATDLSRDITDVAAEIRREGGLREGYVRKGGVNPTTTEFHPRPDPPAPMTKPVPEKMYVLVANERPVQGFWVKDDAETAMLELHTLFGQVTKEGGESWKAICALYPHAFFVGAPYVPMVGIVPMKVV